MGDFRISKNVFEINDNVLVACNRDLKDVIIPEGVVQIGFFAYYQLDNMESLHIPASLTKLTSAFSNSPRLKSITVDENNPCFKAIDGVLYSKDGNVLKRYPPAKAKGVIEIAEGVKAIGLNAFFNCSDITKVVLPSTIKKISDGAFSGCDALTEINLPDGLEKINSTAFNNCRSLKEIKIPATVNKIGFQAFKSCTSLKEIKIPKTTEKVEGWAFAFCRNLKKVEIESEKTIIEIKSFTSCKEIQDIILPQGFNQGLNWYREKFDPEVYYPYALESVSEKGPLLNQIIKNKRHTIDKLIEIDRVDLIKPLLEKSTRPKLADLDELIEDMKAVGRADLTGIFLDYKRNNYTEEELEKYENDRFEKELGLKERTIGEWTKIFKIRSGGETASINRYIGRDSCVEIPENIGKYKVVEIDNSAFKMLPITSITFPKTIKRIGFNAFCACQLLINVDLPKGIKEVENGLFESCPNLKYVTIPKGVKTIKEWAFYNCQSLESVTIPATVTKIDECAFSLCPRLTIKAPLNSYAEEYARDYNVRFEEI